MSLIDSSVSALTTLLVVLDPIGLVPLFLLLTSHMSAPARRRTALYATSIACLVLLFFATLGEQLLDALGITLPAFRIAGGLMLFYTAFEMVFGSRRTRNQVEAQHVEGNDTVTSVAAFPLALPLLAGPGAITACILLSGAAGASLVDKLSLLIVIVIASACCLVAFLAADPLDKVLGTTGKSVLTRLFGVLLAALAVQFVADGAVAIAAGR